MPESTISDILQSVQNYFVVYQAHFNAEQLSFDTLRETTFTVNKELNGLNATLKDSYIQLREQDAINDEEYFDGLSAVGQMITSGETGILGAIDGLVSCIIIHVFMN